MEGQWWWGWDKRGGTFSVRQTCYAVTRFSFGMSVPTTMRQIAERPDVSIGTVSHVINGTAKVREKLRLRVLEAIRSLGYQPSQLRRGLRRTQTSILVLLSPALT